MKKYFLFLLAAILCCVMTTTVFTAYTTEEEGRGASNDNSVAVAVKAIDTIKVTDELLEKFNLTIDYYDVDGKIKTEPLTTNTWIKSFKTPLPAKVGVRLRLNLKEGVTKEDVKGLSFRGGRFSYFTYVVDQTDRLYSSSVHGDGSEISVHLPTDETRLEGLLNIYKNAGIEYYLYTYDENGNYSSGAWQ